MRADLLTLPVAPDVLSRLVARLWGDHGDGRGVALEAGVHPNEIHVFPGANDGMILVEERYEDGWTTFRGGRCGFTVVGDALSALADALRDAGLVVDETSGIRVVGWAAVHTFWRAAEPGGERHRTRIVDLDPTDPRREAHDSAVLTARLARRGAPGLDARRAHGEAAAAAQRASVRRAGR